MRKYLVLLLFFLPCAAGAATRLADCDSKSYDVTIVNGGQTRVATLSPSSGVIEEYGPTVSFQLKGQPPVVITEPYDEYCIWGGKIKIQMRDMGNEGHGGNGQR